MYSFMSDNNNIINNHVIKITHYQIFVVVYQNTNILKISHIMKKCMTMIYIGYVQT